MSRTRDIPWRDHLTEVERRIVAEAERLRRRLADGEVAPGRHHQPGQRPRQSRRKGRAIVSTARDRHAIKGPELRYEDRMREMTEAPMTGPT